ncbi:hypothetical protein DRO02_04770 [archaeon]|nr:MAG: hypothetical protein DRO02_04770 [archaeon]RLG64971.1 MAG: hypothetical protein DRO21_03040 [archaeon]RLG66781.1 MAG: hypothetical protein DRN89_00170 [archaeon]HDM23639.1 hypothetical protein [Candidatus Bathyarchaeota archaeon]
MIEKAILPKEHSESSIILIISWLISTFSVFIVGGVTAYVAFNIPGSIVYALVENTFGTILLAVVCSLSWMAQKRGNFKESYTYSIYGGLASTAIILVSFLTMCALGELDFVPVYIPPIIASVLLLLHAMVISKHAR